MDDTEFRQKARGTERKRDCDHIQLLAIFHFVMAALHFFGAAFLFMHYFIMSSMMTQSGIFGGGPGRPPPPNMKDVFSMLIWVYVVLGVLLGVSLLLNIISGVSLMRRKNRTLSLVVSGLNCMSVPLGTILGIFTIIVLSKESVKELYASESDAQS